MKCTNCEREIPEDAALCPYCGERVSQSPETAPSQKPEPKKPSWTGLLLVLIIGACIVGWAILQQSGGSGGTRKVTLPTSAPTTYRVKYEVTGTTDRASLTYENESGNTEQRTVAVPWKYEFTAREGQFLYVSAQNENDRGTIKCQILLDGLVLEQASSSGGYVIAGCSGSAGR